MKFFCEIKVTIIVAFICIVSFLWMDSSAYAKTIIEGNFTDKQQVLVINAYHQGYGWTDGQTDAIISGFSEGDDKTVLSIEYLDWKRYPYDENLMKQLNYLKYKYEKKTISVVIATDDIGMQFAIDHRDVLFPDVPIVFTGVDKTTALEKIEGIDNITGVCEIVDVEGTLEVMSLLQPDFEHIYLISDKSESGTVIVNRVLEAVKDLPVEVSVEPMNDKTYRRIFEELKEPKDHSAVLFASFALDIANDSIPSEMFVRALSDEVELPIYNLYDYTLGYGAIGGSLLSSRLQGEQGVLLAKRILAGEKADDIPLIDTKNRFYSFDYNELKRYDILNSQLPEGSVIINKPKTIYEEYRSVILIFIGIMVLMVSFIIILTININLRRHAQKALQKEHEEVLMTYESLADSEEILKAQNKELVQQQEQINYLAYNDHLTDLPNRLQIKNYSAKLIEACKNNQSKAILVFIDLDNFNYVNTAHGHIIGDRLLAEISERFKAYIEEKGIIGRIGGDEFVCLVGIDEDFDIEHFIEGLMKLFELPIIMDSREVSATASMGYALYPEDGSSYDELLIRADMAMYKMKVSGKSQASRFDLLMNKEMTHKINLTNALKKALENEEFYLVYQPQYNVIEEEIVGYESLLRWNSAELGPVGPNEFISIAEATGDIVDIGYFIIEEAFQFAEKLMLRGEHIKVCINISVVQLLRSDFTERVKVLLDDCQVDVNMIEFEITESVLIESFDVINNQLKELQAFGIHFALDDFGTGYSSLTYLKKLPISTLKIDKTFIDDILEEGERHFFTGTIIDIARQLGFRVVAEGVEELAQVEYLKGCGCKTIQGYWFSKPLAEKEALKLHKK